MHMLTATAKTTNVNLQCDSQKTNALPASEQMLHKRDLFFGKYLLARDCSVGSLQAGLIVKLKNRRYSSSAVQPWASCLSPQDG